MRLEAFPAETMAKDRKNTQLYPIQVPPKCTSKWTCATYGNALHSPLYVCVCVPLTRDVRHFPPTDAFWPGGPGWCPKNGGMISEWLHSLRLLAGTVAAWQDWMHKVHSAPVRRPLDKLALRHKRTATWALAGARCVCFDSCICLVADRTFRLLGVCRKRNRSGCIQCAFGHLFRTGRLSPRFLTSPHALEQ